MCKPAFHSGAPRAKRASGTPWVNKSTHPNKFGNHVTDRPTVRTTGVPMFTLTLFSYFGSPGESWLHINVVVNWQLSKQGVRWPVSPDRIAGSGVDPSRSIVRWQFTRFQMIAGSVFFNSYQICCVYVTIAQHYYDFDFKLTSDAKFQPVFFLNTGGEDLFLPWSWVHA